MSADEAVLSNTTPAPNQMAAHFIDVGQADATLLEFSCGAVLIDTGAEVRADFDGMARLHNYLQAFFARRTDLNKTLDLVVLSHPHKDHTAGVQYDDQADTILSGSVATIRNVVDDDIRGTNDSGIKGQRDLQQYAVDHAAGYEGVTNAEIVYLDGWTNDVIDPLACSTVDPVIRVAWGLGDRAWSQTANDHSVVVRIDFGESSFLFTGDSEERAMGEMLRSYADDLSIFDVDVLKVGHHGSKNGLRRDFLKAVSPEVAVIMAGKAEPEEVRSDDFCTRQATKYHAYCFGHPNKAAIDLLLRGDGSVTSSRDPFEVFVGVSGFNPFVTPHVLPVFKTLEVDRGVYSTTWDGTVVVYASADGTLRVETEN